MRRRRARRRGRVRRHDVLLGRRARRARRRDREQRAVDGRPRERRGDGVRRDGRRRASRQLRGRGTGERGVDGAQGAVAEAKRPGAVRQSDDDLRVSGLRKPVAHGTVLRVDEQRRRAVALRRRRETADDDVRKAWVRGVGGKVAEGDITDGRGGGRDDGDGGGGVRVARGHEGDSGRRGRVRGNGRFGSHRTGAVSADHGLVAPALGRRGGGISREGYLRDV